MDTRKAIRSRRTHKNFTGEPIARAVLEELIALATWAPNHRMTEPWRFFVVENHHMATFAEVVTTTITDDEPAKMLRKRRKLTANLPRLGGFIAVCRTPVPADPRLDREDYGACAAAVQNLMLGATAKGLGSFWSTGVVFERPAVRAFLGVPDGMQQVASIWLGTPVSERGSSRRSPIIVWKSHA